MYSHGPHAWISAIGIKFSVSLDCLSLSSIRLEDLYDPFSFLFSLSISSLLIMSDDEERHNQQFEQVSSFFPRKYVQISEDLTSSNV